MRETDAKDVNAKSSTVSIFLNHFLWERATELKCWIELKLSFRNKQQLYFDGISKFPLDIIKSCYSGFIGLVSRVFANGPGDRGSIPGHIIPKT